MRRDNCKLLDVILFAVMIVLAGCASTGPRASASSLGCMRKVRAELPEGIGDARAHCLASAGIARQCSAGEAWVAGWGKELRDLLGSGDASWADLAADAAGRRCAQNVPEEAHPAALARCCEMAGY